MMNCYSGHEYIRFYLLHKVTRTEQKIDINIYARLYLQLYGLIYKCVL